MDNNTLETLFFGNDEMSGFSETLNGENYISPEIQSLVIKRVKELVEETKKAPGFPGNEIATLCDIFIDLTVSSLKNDCKEAGLLLEELNNLIQEWYK